MANPITRLVRFIFDKNSANKAERDAKSSLGRIGKGFDSLKSKAIALGATIAAAFSVRAIFRFGRESVRIAGEAEAIWKRLEQAIENTGVQYASVRDEINATARAMQDATTVGDEDFARVLSELITTSNDYAKSMDNVATVANLAAAKNIDLMSAAQLVGRAMVGQTATLTRYGIIIKEGEDAMEVLRHQFRGFAENEATTFQGKLQQLTNEWGDFRQAVGNAIIEAGNGRSVLDSLTATVKTMAFWVDENRMELAAWGQVLFAIGRAVAQSFIFIGRITKNAFESLGGAIALFVNKETQRFAIFVNAIIEGINHIPGVNIKFRMNELTPEEFREQQRLLTEGIRENASNMTDALYDLGMAYRDLGKIVADTQREQQKAADTPLPGGGGRGGFAIPEVSFREAPALAPAYDIANQIIAIFEDLQLSIPNQIMADFNSEMELARNMAALTGMEYSALGTEMDLLAWSIQRLLEAGMDPMDSRLQGLSERLREVQHEQELVNKHNELMASVAGTTGEILNAALGAGIGELAAGKAKQNAIMSAEQLAMGLVASLNPFTAPKAAGHYAAAAQFSAIATAWGALAGVTGGLSGNKGGGGVGGFSDGRQSAGDRASSVQEPSTEVHIYLDPLNPNNIDFQRVVLSAEQQARERYGNNVRVLHHSRYGR